MVLNRRQFGATAIGSMATIWAAPSLAQNGKLSLKVGGQFADSHPSSKAMEAACAEIRQQSSGRIDIQFFPNAQLGSDAAMLTQVRSGALDMMTASGISMQVVSPIAGISGMAFAFSDYAHVWQAMDGELGAGIRAGLDKVGIYAFPKILDSGYRNITTSNRPINTVGDLKGMKMRVPPSPVWVSLFTALGSSPTSITINELYSSLQTKIVDGQENPLTIIESGKYYEVQKYCSITEHMWDGLWIIANGKRIKSLPAEDLALITRSFEAATEKQRAETERLNVELEDSLKAKGLVFNRPDKNQFRQALTKAGFYAEWKQKYGTEAWAVLEKYSGSLA
ncbi:TRAP transporter substrate-binding protein [Bradyrhizobium tropiciagri]|uniref:TRAP transporter substrate-binding protein n=1 Tax=Bradyrhizobium tropiciagri TaxID=312253 RepID=UPI001BA44118|nr:TRAP transporter substrate-binding protein [Bradyrhizobium tropiciagri]MBR0870408.1 TRAP transporter substrate-binding protein [Bradyrhizobium tropiciagri]